MAFRSPGVRDGGHFFWSGSQLVVFPATGVESEPVCGPVFPECRDRVAVAVAIRAQLQNILAARFASERYRSLDPSSVL